MRTEEEISTGKLVVIGMTALIFAMTGCGGVGNNVAGGGSAGNRLAQGNWSIIGTSTTTSQVYSIGGHIQQSGNQLSGTMHVLGPCEDSQASDPGIYVPLTGSVSGNQFTFTVGPTLAGSVVKVVLSGSGSSLSALTGTFTVSGGCGTTDQGAAVATLVPSISGTWAGTGVASAGNSNVSVSVTFVQSSAPNQFGAYDLTGTVNYTSSTCTATGVDLFGDVFGSHVFLDVDEASINPVLFFFSGSVDNPATPASFTGTYLAANWFGVISGCAGDAGTIQLTKQ